MPQRTRIMDLSVSKLPWYGQMGLFLVLSLAGVGVFYYWYVMAAQESLAARQQQLTALRADIAKGVATARKLPEFRQQVTDLERRLETLKPVLPDEKDVAELLRRIQTMATQSNLAIRTFTPAPVVQKQMYAEWPIGLEIDGTYHNLGAFLDRVSRFPRIINITGIKIKAKEPPTAEATISAQCTATTFVLSGEAPKPATPGAPGTPATPGAPAATGTTG